MKMNVSNKNSLAPLYAATSVIVRFGTGPLTILGVAAGLTAQEQGIFYVFLSLVALQWVLELGVSTNLVQYLSAASNDNDKQAAVKLATLYYFIVAVILVVALLSLVNLVIVDVDSSQWYPQWVLLVLLAPFNLLSTLLLSVKEGLGNWGRSYFIKLISSFVYALTLILCLYSGLKLWSLSVALMMMIITTVVMCGFGLFKYVSNALRSGIGISRVLRETSTFQGKMMAVWLIGYFYWNAFILAASRVISIEFSGQLGMAMVVLTAFSMVGINIVQSQRALFTRLISDGAQIMLQRLLVKRVLLSVFIYFFGVSVVCIAMGLVKLELWSRFVEMGLLIELAAVRLMMMLYELMLLVGRSYGDEPFWVETLILYICFFLGVSMTMLYTSDVYLSARVGVLLHVIFIPLVFTRLVWFMKKNEKYKIMECE
jgi:O-antigen/teichoic acid export membrane protein